MGENATEGARITLAHVPTDIKGKIARLTKDLVFLIIRVKMEVFVNRLEMDTLALAEVVSKENCVKRTAISRVKVNGMKMKLMKANDGKIENGMKSKAVK